MKECDIFGGQNILWPLLHIFRGSGPQPPGSTPLAKAAYVYIHITCNLHARLELHQDLLFMCFTETLMSSRRIHIEIPLKNSWIKIQIQIASKIQSFLPWPTAMVPHFRQILFKKIKIDSSSFCIILQNKQSENITSLAELTSTATFLKFLLAQFTLDKAGSPRRESFRIVLQKFFTGRVSFTSCSKQR